MKRSSFAMCMLFFTVNCLGQPDSVKIRDHIYNELYKNIAAYYINYAVKSKKDLTNEDLLLQKKDGYFFDKCLPDYDYKLDMQITKLDCEYPINGFIVYKVKLNGLRFSSISTKKVKLIQLNDGFFNQPPSNYYLISVDQKNDIKFLSGSCFLHDISNDFNLNPKTPNSYIEYLNYKTFFLQTKQIAFLKNKGEDLYFEAYSNELNKKIVIIVDSKSPWKLDLKVGK